MSRKSKGYCWEADIVKKFEKLGFVAERLGGTTTAMPDVVAHKDGLKLIIGIECKSVSGKYACVPSGQIQRCIDETNKWGLYSFKMVILAFQFGKFGLKGEDGYREKKEYLKIWNFHYPVTNVSCHYDGRCFANNEEVELEVFP